METALRLALEREEFMVHYQPIVETRTDQVCSFEALVRWNHPELGVLSPSEFITIAEECGLISKLGRWVLRRACEDAVRWNQGGHPPISVAVNVSALQLGERTLVDAVVSTLKHTRLPAELLELELTESALLNRENSSIASMQLLHQLGVRFALDDFGTGYSSLASLRELPLSTLKIDRLFVTDLPSSESDAAIVRSIIALSQNLGLRVIGEGVENTLQVQKLTAMGCGNLQGFLFGKPSPYAEAVALARARRLISVA
jgi:EAL domain-containing protein (putative c-di-GMP-specific phosphodiesterase class I)